MIITFQQLAALYLDRHLRTKPTYAYYVRLHRQFFAGWTEHPTPFQVRAWHAGFATVPSHANKALGYLKAMYRWASITGDVTGQKALWEGGNPAEVVHRHAAQSRERVLTDAELTLLLTYLGYASQKFEAFLTVLLCTGSRMGEVRKMEWQHVDVVHGSWYKPRTKNGSAHRIPLVRQVAEVLRELPRDGRYVFAGHYDRCWSSSGVEKAWGEFRSGLGMEDVRLHDFRRTVASRIYEQTRDEKLVKAIINHKDHTVSGVYIRLQPHTISQALQAYADKIWSMKGVRHEGMDVGARAVDVGWMHVGSETQTAASGSGLVE